MWLLWKILLYLESSISRIYLFPGNMNSREMILSGKCHSPVNLTFWDMWLQEKCDSLRNMNSGDKYLFGKKCFPDKVNYWELWPPWEKWQVWYYVDILTSGHEYMWQVWPGVTSLTTGHTCDPRWQVWPRMTSMTIRNKAQHKYWQPQQPRRRSIRWIKWANYFLLKGDAHNMDNINYMLWYEGCVN